LFISRLAVETKKFRVRTGYNRPESELPWNLRGSKITFTTGTLHMEFKEYQVKPAGQLNRVSSMCKILEDVYRLRNSKATEYTKAARQVTT